MFTLLFIGMITSMVVAWLFIRRLQERPWAQHGIIEGSQAGLTSSAPKVGLWIFLGVVTSIFLVFTGAYFMRMDTTHGGIAAGYMHGWVPLDEPRVLWLNTIVLILASIAIQLAHGAAARSDIAGMRRAFNTAGFLTILFLFGQLFAWQQLYATDQFHANSPAFSFFVLLTAVHGLHLVGGLVVWSRTAGRLRRGLDKASLVEVNRVSQSVQLCATYWHYLLLIWLGLFVLLLST
jgi:cytochrome c oxidase subunit III